MKKTFIRSFMTLYSATKREALRAWRTFDISLKTAIIEAI